MDIDNEKYPYQFPPGHLIDGRYKVLEPLGAGGFSEVYKCQDTKLGRVYAVKVMNLLVGKEDALREARIAVRLDHPHILRVFDIGELEGMGNWYILMDYKEESRTLEAMLDAAQNNLRRLPLNDQTLQIISQVAEALQYAHQRGIVHQDVKPSNVIIDRGGQAYLSDFGLAMTKRPAGTGTSMKTLDAQSGMSGTIPYMSPEQFEELEEGKQLGPSTDTYSLAVVTYEMLVGQLPYPGKAPGPIIRQIVDGVRTPPRQLNAEIEEKVQDVLLRALNKEPVERYGSPTEFAAALGDAAQAYITAEKLYGEARSLVNNRKWREALASLEQLEEYAPAYKDTRLLMERVQKQVQLLELYEEAQDLSERGEYEACLDKLDVLKQLAPNYVVKTVREKALSALEERLYQRAGELYQAGEYQECLNTLDEIRRRDPSFVDKEGVTAQARRAFEHQQYLQRLYDTSVEEIREENWEAAHQALEKLHQEDPDYADVEARLVMVRHMARLSGMYQAAHQLCDEGEFAQCIDQLKELVQIDSEYKSDQTHQLRQQAIGGLYEKAERLLKEERFEQAIQALNDLDGRTKHGDPHQVRERAKKGIADRELRKRLDALYQKAVGHLRARRYKECIDTMTEIRRADPNYEDSRDVEQRARDSWCNLMYTQALGALTQKRYQEALDRWNEISEINPRFEDSQNIREQAMRGLSKPDWFAFVKKLKPAPREAGPELEGKRKKVRTLVLYGIIAVVVIAILLGGGWGGARLIRNRRATATAVALAAQAEIAVTEQANATATAVALTSIAQDRLTKSAVESVTQEAIATATQEAIETATQEMVATATQEAIEAATQEAVATATQEAIAAATRAAIPTLTQSAIRTATRSAIETATAQPTPTATPTPIPQAKAREASSVYEGPNSGTREVAIVVEGKSVAILGRSEERYGRWLYVQAGEAKGFTYAPRFEYTVAWESLEVIEAEVVLVSTPTPTISAGGELEISPGTLEIVHIWPATVCTGKGRWVAYFEVKIAGGDGRNYKLFWDEEPIDYIVKESERDVAVIQRPGIVGTLVGTVWVESGGQRAGQATSASEPDCD